MIESSELRWLHISDLHIGSPANEWVDTTLRVKLKDLLQRIGKLDFILISGDIIHQGNFNNTKNANEAKTLFALLKEHADHLLLCVGNHDYIRNGPRTLLLKEWQGENDEDKSKSEHEYRSKLQGDYIDFSKFCEDLNIENANTLSSTDIFTGVEGINIVILNTCCFCGQPKLTVEGEIETKDGKQLVDDYGKIRLTESDLPKSKELKPAWPTIIVGHHPFQMMDETSRKRLTDIMVNIPAYNYFCGHAHKIEITSIGEGLHQYTSAGLFVDSYNHPTIGMHWLKKAQNTKIHSEFFSFEHEDWNGLDLHVDSNEPNEQSKEPSLDADSSSTEIKVSPYFVEQSNYSDGAFSFPYNNGFFNIYSSTARPDDILIPHVHSETDEVTYVIKGKVIEYVDGKMSLLEEGGAINTPKGKLHSFIPLEYPSKYITMSIDNSENSTGRNNVHWVNDIATINHIESEINEECEKIKSETDETTSKYLSLYDSLITFLSSPILEVCWKATDVIKKYIAQENEDTPYIIGKIEAFITSKLKSEKIPDKLYGLSLAYEFRMPLNNTRIRSSLSSKKNFMLAWACAYNVIIRRVKIDYSKLYIRILDSPDYDLSIKYHELCLLSVLELLINHNGKLLDDASSLSQIINMPESCIPLEDLLSYFILWYTSFTFQDTYLNFTKASQVLNDICPDLAEEFLRKMQTTNDSQDRADIMKTCREKGVLLPMAKGFFESIEESGNDESSQFTSIKRQIKKYLRVIVSERCNLKCVYCHHEGRVDALIGEKIADNHLFDLKELLNQAVDCGYTKIKISGGEPLLFPNVLQICNAFQDKFDDIGFTSNGTKIMELQPEFERIKGSKLSFNITLNSIDPKKYQEITGMDTLAEVKEGIEYLVDNGFKVKINTVITSKNVDDIESLIAYAARLGISIKLLDLFSIGAELEDFQHVSIAEIKSRIMTLYRKQESDFTQINDYICVNVLNTDVLIPRRVYSADCQLNCNKYPCAEGLFGIRVYEDYSCAYCFNGKVYQGNLDTFRSNTDLIRNKIDSIKISY